MKNKIRLQILFLSFSVNLCAFRSWCQEHVLGSIGHLLLPFPPILADDPSSSVVSEASRLWVGSWKMLLSLKVTEMGCKDGIELDFVPKLMFLLFVDIDRTKYVGN